MNAHWKPEEYERRAEQLKGGGAIEEDEGEQREQSKHMMSPSYKRKPRKPPPRKGQAI
jgi:hypothetical protein